MNTPAHNAFTINTFGGGQFPISVERKTPTVLWLCPMRLADLWDVLALHMHPTVAFFDYGGYGLEGRPWDGTPPTLAESARAAGLSHVAHGHDLIITPATAAGPFVRRLAHYQLTGLDLPVPSPSLDTLANVYCAVADRRGPRLPLAGDLPQPTFFVDVHDDCYVYVECAGPLAPAVFTRLIARLLAMAAATFWAVAQSKSIPAGVALPPDDVVASLMASGAFSVPPDGVTGDAATVTLRFSRSAFPFRGDLPYSTAGTLTYTFASRVWRVQETPCA